MKAPSLVTEMHYDITCGPGDVCWEEKTWTRRTGERRAFKTVDSADKDSTGCLFFLNIFLFLIPANICCWKCMYCMPVLTACTRYFTLRHKQSSTFHTNTVDQCFSSMLTNSCFMHLCKYHLILKARLFMPYLYLTDNLWLLKVSFVVYLF